MSILYPTPHSLSLAFYFLCLSTSLYPLLYFSTYPSVAMYMFLSLLLSSSFFWKRSLFWSCCLFLLIVAPLPQSPLSILGHFPGPASGFSLLSRRYSRLEGTYHQTRAKRHSPSTRCFLVNFHTVYYAKLSHEWSRVTQGAC